MSKCEFEEKSIETACNQQLAQNTPEVFAPGQVLEHELGFDAGLLTHHPYFWGLFSSAPLAGAVLTSTPMPGTVPRRSLPPFRLNAFLQYKTPQLISRSTGTEWASWSKPYFRFDFDSNQQGRLVALDTAVSTLALVAYAAPAFNTYADLFHHTASQTVVQNMVFFEVKRVASHTRFTFVSHGTVGILHSEPEELMLRSFKDLVGARLSSASVFHDWSEGLTDLAERLIRATEAHGPLHAPDLLELMLKGRKLPSIDFPIRERHLRLLAAMRVIETFCWGHGLSWQTIAKE